MSFLHLCHFWMQHMWNIRTPLPLWGISVGAGVWVFRYVFSQFSQDNLEGYLFWIVVYLVQQGLSYGLMSYILDTHTERYIYVLYPNYFGIIFSQIMSLSLYIWIVFLLLFLMWTGFSLDWKHLAVMMGILSAIALYTGSMLVLLHHLSCGRASGVTGHLFAPLNIAPLLLCLIFQEHFWDQSGFYVPILMLWGLALLSVVLLAFRIWVREMHPF